MSQQSLEWLTVELLSVEEVTGQPALLEPSYLEDSILSWKKMPEWKKLAPEPPEPPELIFPPDKWIKPARLKPLVKLSKKARENIDKIRKAQTEQDKWDSFVHRTFDTHACAKCGSPYSIASKTMAWDQVELYSCTCGFKMESLFYSNTQFYSSPRHSYLGYSGSQSACHIVEFSESIDGRPTEYRYYAEAHMIESKLITLPVCLYYFKLCECRYTKGDGLTLHRMDGPAAIGYKEDGTISGSSNHINGQRIPSKIPFLDANGKIWTINYPDHRGGIITGPVPHQLTMMDVIYTSLNFSIEYGAFLLDLLKKNEAENG